VTQAARRARELQEHPDSSFNESYHSYKPVGKALEELSQGKLNISK
jgi:DNA-directed RNA polymerase subunit omega